MSQNTFTSMLLDSQSMASDHDYFEQDPDDTMEEISCMFVSLLNAASRSTPEEELIMEIDLEVSSVLTNVEEDGSVADKPKEPAKYYRNYKIGQKVDFIRLILEMKSVRQAAGITGMKLKTAYALRDYWNKHGEIAEAKKRGPKPSPDLQEEHVDFILNLIDDWAPTTLAVMREKLMEGFPGLKVSKTGIYRFIKTRCALSMKKLELHSERRRDPSTLKARRNVVQQWMDDPMIEFESNCVFIDEAGFNMHITRTRGWSIKGTPAINKAPKDCGVNFSTLGAISPEGVIDISVKKPQYISCKKRSSNGAIISEEKLIGTRSDHFRAYVERVMDTLDDLGLTGRNLVMDNATIHHNPETVGEIERRGYRPVFLPPYSPFLNPIEEFWSKVKYGVKRHPFDNKASTLTQRISVSVRDVTISDCNGWIRHSRSLFDDCLALRQL
ncbi:hypothetical protein [Parasitella parasitica]|uniref:Tc1-like transposase DDE domain-containing protein n=1 Tax=Parasitella parasitica TaxID=35722 RepID=A0A0B7N331_9FUNG|nr:hypothetical protein [Parasitella parasitica]